ncbi:hypothetical protein HC743_18090 [Bacillus subtilis]|uniref:hypothetical protein n=1 Tax=Bacillus TaxID=1386 RepID=UPI0012E07637|nr:MULTISPECIES: hypothetical protein [Bacillus]MBW9315914.1 hypothetical protein [Bacillus subtilis]NJJ25682.1 hypothetical protein [Bacillus subtilis]
MRKNCGCGRRVVREEDLIIINSCPELSLEVSKPHNSYFQITGTVTCNSTPLENVNVTLTSSSNSIVKPIAVKTNNLGEFSSKGKVLSDSWNTIEVTATIISNGEPISKTVTINK